MDILNLIERLEDVVNGSRRVPVTNSLLVDEARIYNVIDQMRHAIPPALTKANRIEAERDRILAQANEEGERIRELARQEAIEQVNRDSTVIAAQRRADNLIERAERDADRIRYEADTYAAQMLAQLEQNLTRSLSVVRNGLAQLEESFAQQQAPPNQLEDDQSVVSE